MDDRQPVPVPVPVARGWRRVVLLSAAGLLVPLGILGAILPGLPATPFLLLASYLLLRSSPRLNDRLLRSRLLGPILVDWQRHGGVRPHVKIKAVAAVALGVSLTLFLTRYSPPVMLAVLLLATVGLTVIVRLPTARPPSVP